MVATLKFGIFEEKAKAKTKDLHKKTKQDRYVPRAGVPQEKGGCNLSE